MANIHTALGFPYPGTPVTADGSDGVVWVETHISQGACAFPITPSTNMGVLYAQAVADGQTNLWGEAIWFLEPESEHSSASAAEGFALAGGRVTNFTSGQGLVLMKEVLHVISGKRLPVVFNIGARALTSQALNVHAGHDDVMGVSDTGWGMLFARNAQEATDLCLIARKAAESTATPFMNIQDGFLTTHTVESLLLPEAPLMSEYIGEVAERHRALFDPELGIMSGVVQNQDAYMRGRIAQRYYYDQLPRAVQVAMEEYYGLTGRRYRPAAGYRMEDAEFAIVALGTIAETAEAVADYLRESRGLRLGVVHPTVFRPFPGPELVELLKPVKRIAVVERMDNPPGQSNPLTMELKAAFADALTGRPGYPEISRLPEIVSGSAGLGGRDVRPADLIAAVDQMVAGRKEHFSLNLDHAEGLAPVDFPDVRPEGAFSMRGYSIGGYGSVTTNKVIATVAADLFDVYVQAYPLYGSEKKGLPTNYYLTLAPERIRIHCGMEAAEFIPFNNANALRIGNPVQGLGKAGTVFVQWQGEDPRELWEQFPLFAREAVSRAAGRVVFLDAARIAREESSLPELAIRMQGIVLLGVFLRYAPYREQARLSERTLFKRVEEALSRYFGKVSAEAVAENLRCVKRGFREVKEVPQALIDAHAEETAGEYAGRQVSEIMHHGVITCKPADKLEQVVETMNRERISAVVVVGDGGMLEGLISTSDIARARAVNAGMSGAPQIFPAHLMTSQVLVTWPEEPLQTAVERMLSHHVHRLVVVKSQQEPAVPVGILSMTDLARTLTQAE